MTVAIIVIVMLAPLIGFAAYLVFRKPRRKHSAAGDRQEKP